MAEVQHTASGNGAPTGAPPSNAAHYVDLETGDHYLASGTDWGTPVGRQGHVTLTAPGVVVVPQGTAVVEAYTQAVVEDAEWVLEMPAVPHGRAHVFDVVSLSAGSSNTLVLRTAMEGGLLFADFVGPPPASSEFTAGELRIAMGSDYLLRVYVTAVPPGNPDAGKQLLLVVVVTRGVVG